MPSTAKQFVASALAALLLPLGFFCAGSASATSAIVYVNAGAAPGGNGQDWAHAYRSLQDALTTAANTQGAKQIWVAAGTYKPGTSRTASFIVTDQTAIYGGFAGNETSLSQRIIGSNVTRLSGDLAGNDIVDRNDPGYSASRADNAFHVVTIADSATATLDGLVVSGGYANGSLSDSPFSGTGAGIYVDSDGFAGIGSGSGTGYLTLRNVAVSQNSAMGRPGRVGSGGGLWQLAGRLTIDRSVFVDNFAPDVGGALVAGNFLFGSMLEGIVITDSSFTRNATTRIEDLGVGTLQVEALSLSVERNTFSKNVGVSTVFQLAYRRGAGALNTALVADNTFSENSAARGFGGALMLLGNVTASAGKPILTLRGNTFTHNTSSDFGGALFVGGRGDYLIEANTFTHNSASVGGGAMWVNFAQGNVIVRDCHFVQNVVTGAPVTFDFLNYQAQSGLFFSPAEQLGGGGLLVDDLSRVRIEATKFTGNTAPIGGAVSLAGYSYLEGPAWDLGDGLPKLKPPKYASTVTEPASVVIANSSFANNQATEGDGGAIFAGALTTPALSFAGGTFPALTAFGPTAIDVTGSSFQQNTASARGGAMAGEHTAASVAQNTFVNNQAAGGGLHLYFSAATVNAYSTASQAGQARQSLLTTNSFQSPNLGGIVVE